MDLTYIDYFHMFLCFGIIQAVEIGPQIADQQAFFLFGQGALVETDGAVGVQQLQLGLLMDAVEQEEDARQKHADHSVQGRIDGEPLSEAGELFQQQQGGTQKQEEEGKA